MIGFPTFSHHSVKKMNLGKIGRQYRAGAFEMYVSQRLFKVGLFQICHNHQIAINNSNKICRNFTLKLNLKLLPNKTLSKVCTALHCSVSSTDWFLFHSGRFSDSLGKGGCNLHLLNLGQYPCQDFLAGLTQCTEYPTTVIF